MKITRKKTIYSSEELDNFDLVPSTVYSVDADIRGKNWYGSPCEMYNQKESYSVNDRHGVETFEDILSSFYLAKTGDFQDGLFTEFFISWHDNNGDKLMMTLHCDDRDLLPVWAKDYFWKEDVS